MIAKLAVWGQTRQVAIERIKRALDEYEVAGITTTLPFFRQLVRDEEFIAGHLDTGFIGRFNARQAAATPEAPSMEETDMAIIAASLLYLTEQRRKSGPATSSVNRWKMSGRNSALDARRRLGEQTSSTWRKL
jgi:acetyl/propionyl-CoA carboxylase alpha subunit